MLIALFISDLLEGVDVNPERHTKKQSEHHMPSFGENKHNLFLTHCLATVIQFSLIDIRGGGGGGGGISLRSVYVPPIGSKLSWGLLQNQSESRLGLSNFYS